MLALLYIPIIVGSAFIVGPIQTHSLSHLPPQQSPHGVTIFSTGFQIAGCIGASLFSSLYATSVISIPKASDAFLIVGLIVAGLAVIGVITSIIVARIKRTTPQTENIEQQDSTNETITNDNLDTENASQTEQSTTDTTTKMQIELENEQQTKQD